MTADNGWEITARYRGVVRPLLPRPERMMVLIAENQEKIDAEEIGTVEFHYTLRKVFGKLKKHLGLEKL